MEYKFRTLGNITVLGITGSLDRSTTAPVQSWLESHAGSQSKFVVVNLEGLKHLDSSGLSTLVSGLKLFRAAGGGLCLCCLPNQIRILFELTRLNLAFEIYPTEDAAIQSTEKRISRFAGLGLNE